jgi:general secretion pathway protein A
MVLEPHVARLEQVFSLVSLLERTCVRLCGAPKGAIPLVERKMYKSFFNLRESPFNVNVDPRFFFPTRQTEETLQRLAYGIRNRRGLILLTGEVGTGKTMMLNQLLDWLRQLRTPTAFVFNSNLGEGDLFNLMACDFGIATEPSDRSNLPIRLNRWLCECCRTGVSPVLIVDEAQGLPFERFEEIRLLLNIETASEKMLQIVFAGQPELDERLNRPEGRQLRQRIAVRCKINALTVEQTHGYIEQRLRIAGASGAPIFQRQAMDAVHFYARGIPRVINLICEHSLINAYVDQLRSVPAHIVDEVAGEFQVHDASVRPPSIQSTFEWPRPVSAHHSAETQRARAAVAGISSRFPDAGPGNQPCATSPALQAFSSTPTISEASSFLNVPVPRAAVSESTEQRGHWPLVLPAPSPVQPAQHVSVPTVKPVSSSLARAVIPVEMNRPAAQARSIENRIRQRRWIHGSDTWQAWNRWWSIRRDECLSVFRLPALRRMAAFLLRRLGPAKPRVHRSHSIRRWQNLHHRRSSAPTPLRRYLLSSLDRDVASFVERARQGRTAIFRWLQQPLSSLHRR